jgi:hypothetical protein
MACTGGTDGRWAGGEVDIGDPVAHTPAAAETQHDEFVRGVGGDEAGYICCEAVFKLGQGVCVCCFDASAVSLRTGDFGVGRVVVAEAVGGGRVLGEELELVEDGGGYGYARLDDGLGEGSDGNIPRLWSSTGAAVTE